MITEHDMVSDIFKKIILEHGDIKNIKNNKVFYQATESEEKVVQKIIQFHTKKVEDVYQWQRNLITNIDEVNV